MKFTILLFDRFPIMTSALCKLFENNFPECSVVIAKNIDEVILLSSKIKFDLILLDVVNNNSNFQELFYVFFNHNVNIKIVLFVDYDYLFNEDEFKYQNSVSILYKSSSVQKILQHLRLSLYGEIYFSNNFKIDVVSSSMINSNSKILSKRELECAVLLLRGFKLKSIAFQLSLSISTIGTHKLRIFKKTRTKNLVELNDFFKKKYPIVYFQSIEMYR